MVSHMSFLGKMFKYVSLNEVLAIINASLKPLGTIKVDIRRSAGYVASSDIKAPADIPKNNISLVDGFSLNISAIKSDPPIKIPLCKEDRVTSRCAKYVKTCEEVPSEHNAVVPLEVAKVEGDNVIIFKRIELNENILKRSSDVRKDEVIIRRGAKILPQHIRLLGELGIEFIEVFRKPRIAVIPIGDEYVSGLAKEYTTYTLCSIMRNLGYLSVHRLGPLGDDVKAILTSIKELLESGNYDVVVTVGGSSIGLKDFTWLAVKNLKASYSFRGVKIYPGKTTSFVGNGDKAIVVLPGPLYSALCGLIFVLLPSLRRLEGMSSIRADKVCCIGTLLRALSFGRFKPFSKVVYSITKVEEGHIYVEPFDIMPHSISQPAKANSFILVDEGVDSIPKGSPVEVRIVEGIF
ncbi:MAG: hypothetical protein DRO18_03600 [Thermoprotei archaeon]|nr:MAG: hypothetical protein DRO18_03600 [Thermoprotei archaeon]